MRIHAVYRSSASVGKRRPAFFSKRLALLSFLRAVRACSADVRITFLNDGDVDPDCRSLMEGQGEPVELDGIGNCASYRVALAELERGSAAEGDLAYLAEEDYLYVEDAFAELLRAAAAIPVADYFSLHDHPNQYRVPAMRNDEHFDVGGRRWRTVDNSTMTFAARVPRLRRDAWLHWLGTQKQYPHDGGIWGATLGARRYRLARTVGSVDLVPWNGLVLRHVVKGSSRRAAVPLMVVPAPTLATHGEVTDVAPGVDWENEAATIDAWGREYLPLDR